MDWWTNLSFANLIHEPTFQVQGSKSISAREGKWKKGFFVFVTVTFQETIRSYSLSSRNSRNNWYGDVSSYSISSFRFDLQFSTFVLPQNRMMGLFNMSLKDVPPQTWRSRPTFAGRIFQRRNLPQISVISIPWETTGSSSYSWEHLNVF